MNQPGGHRDSAALRSAHTARVLAEIRRRGEIARVDLAQALDVSPATVSAVVSGLVAQGLVLEAAPVSGSSVGRGRPRVMLSLNPKARHVAGAKLNSGSVTVAILDFTGEVLADSTEPLRSNRVEPNDLRTALVRGFHAAVTQAGLSVDAIAGFGVGIPGFVERETGACHWSPLLRGTPVNVGELLQPWIPCPVHVDNDANLATLTELWFGLGREHRDFVVVTIEHGVGMGIVIDGQLYRGARGLGAEFGHTKVQIDGALCRCGQRGCIEAYVADFALVREAETVLRGETMPQETQAIIELLAQRAREGDAGAASIFRRAGRMLGVGLANVINVFDPGILVLAGERMRYQSLMQDEIETVMQQCMIRGDRPPARVAVHRWGDSLWARGAGALALEALSAEAALEGAQVA